MLFPLAGQRGKPGFALAGDVAAPSVRHFYDAGFLKRVDLFVSITKVFGQHRARMFSDAIRRTLARVRRFAVDVKRRCGHSYLAGNRMFDLRKRLPRLQVRVFDDLFGH